MIAFAATWSLSVRAARTLQATAPSNRLIEKIRGRRRSAIPGALLATVGYLALARIVEWTIDAGAPDWLQLLALTALWNAFKFIALCGAVSAKALLELALSEKHNSRNRLE